MRAVVHFRAVPVVAAAEPAAAAAPATRDSSGAVAPAAVEVPVGRLAPDPEQPRTSFSEERLYLLAESIRASGVIQPLLARDHPDPVARLATPYMLIVGERRWRAARRAGLATVPVLLHALPLAPLDRLMMQIAENDGELHEELPLYDLAAAVARAFRLAGASRSQFASRYRRSRSWLDFLLRMDAAEGVAREALHEGHLRGILAASTFLRLTDCQQRRLVAEARRSGNPITLRRAEKAAEQTGLRRSQCQAAARPDVPRSATAVSAVRFPGTPGSATAAASPAAQLPTAAPSPAAQLPTVAASPAARVPTAAAAPAAPFPASSAVPAAAHSAGAAPAFCQRCRAAMSEPAPERRSAGGSARAAERGKRLQLLPAPPPPVALRRPRVDGPWITLEITGQQLERLVVLLGKKPAASARAQVEQLLACL